MKKRIISLILISALLVAALTGCAGNGKRNDRLKIVATIFPEYDWVREILGDRLGEVELTLLLDNGVDLHSFQPTVDDIILINSCDLFIYVGGESDDWAESVLGQAKNGPEILDLLDILGDLAKSEEVREGMQTGADDEEEKEDEKDEHVWLSLKNASLFCDAIASKLAQLDSDNGDYYSSNADAYKEKLNALDGRYSAAVEAGRVKTLLFGDRFPFRYLTDDYGLDYYAAFSGCSAECEASFETVVFLAGKVDSLGLKSIIRLEGSDGKIAQTVKDATSAKNQTVLVLDSMQSTGLEGIENGETYLSVMEKNLEVLTDALK